MRNWITLLMTLLVGVTSYANANMGQLTFEAGYRRDDISWKSRVPASDPTLRTDTRFKDLDIFQVGIHGRTTLGYNLYLRGNAYFGWILDGNFRETVDTYFSAGGYNAGNFVGHETNRRHNIVDNKHVFGLGAAIGYPFYFCDCTMILAPVVGYSFDEQNLKVNDQGFDLYGTSTALVPVTGGCCCDHKWINRWYGPFVGVDLSYRPYNQCWSLYGEVEYHWGEFRGRRHGNNGGIEYGTNGHSFHTNNAHSWLVTVGADYDLYNGWTAGLSLKFQDWKANKKHHISHNDSRDDYDNKEKSQRQHNHFKWNSGEIKLALGREF